MYRSLPVSSPESHLTVCPSSSTTEGGNLPTGQAANGPVLVHFLLTFLINPSAVPLI